MHKQNRVRLEGGHVERIERIKAEWRKRERTEKPRNSETLQQRKAEMKNTDFDQC